MISQASPRSESNFVKLFHGKTTDLCGQLLSAVNTQKVLLQDYSGCINGFQANQRAHVASSIGRVIVQAGIQRS